ncbi:MAG: TolC family protein, partial [Bacteroidaceae bacterium]|nr:TolC family protein [Bacteroidaceae bacterium]
TNTYTNVSTFYNGYGVTASIPVFDGLQRWNSLQTAKANVLMGRLGIRAQKDDVAQRVLRQYLDALYYRGTLSLACQKRAESRELLRQSRVMAEVGLRSDADTAQMRATYAADDYEVTRQ